MNCNWSEYFKINTSYHGNWSEFWREYFENTTCNDSGRRYEYYHFQTKMCTFVFGPMILLGLVGNIISFFTWGKLTHQNALTFLLRTLAIIDSCLLLNEVFRVLTSGKDKFSFDGWLYVAADVLWPYIRA